MSHFNYTCNAIKSFCFRVGSRTNTTNGRNLRRELAFHSTGGDAAVSPADPNLVLAAFTNTVPYREVQLNTFMEFSKYLRVSSKGILVSE